ncbi:OmpA family protein [Desulfonatronum thiodismutans]|uniref:OmpA family protein n=1 Tax=Desulfonatronum thiodismutans TaxID=159290 RepID=UPI0004ABED52|nr:OmpA family protein [Desulfonatronum thiodismutans]
MPRQKAPPEKSPSVHQHPLNIPEFSLERGEQRSVTWSVPWSDLMMVMFILFLVLFVFSLREKDRMVIGHRTPASIQTVSSSPAQLNMLPLYEVLRDRLLGHERSVNVAFLDDASIVISLFGENLFPPLSHELDLRSRPLLSKIGHTVALAQGNVVITGFADDAHTASEVPGPPSGGRARHPGVWEVAALRAAAVAEHFVRETGLNPDMLIIQATGADRPLTPRLSGREHIQRRVEIRIEP